MGIFSTLQTGVSGLKASELQIATTGNNISNANATFYTRQRVVQTTNSAITSNGVQVGSGTKVDTIKRLHDEYSYFKLKNATNQLEYSKYMKSTLEEISQRFPDIQGTGILKDYENYMLKWNAFASNPNESATKIDLIETSKTFAQSLNNTFATLDKIQKQVNDQIKLSVDEINSLGKEIADLNKKIEQQEILDTDNANELRDRRDELELRMSKLVGAVASKTQITQDNTFDSVMTDSGHRYNLSIEGFSIVDGSTFHPLSLEFDNKDQAYHIQYIGSDEKVRDMTSKITGGQLGAQLDLRGRHYDKLNNKFEDGKIQSYIDNLNTFAKSLITQTNNIYASSAKHSINSDYFEGLTANTSLQNYDKNIQNGTFDIVIYDENGTKVGTKTIEVNERSTPASIIAAIMGNTDDNANNNSQDDIDDHINASFTYDNATGTGSFQISARSGFKIALEDKGTNFPGSFSLGGFFSGTNAQNISVKSELINDPSQLRASKSGVDSGNDMANDMLQLQYEKINFYNEDGTVDKLTIEEYYRKLTGQIASEGENNNFLHAGNETLYNSVYAEFQSLNGVNTNEELAALIQYQASYGAASKIITTINQMLDTLLGLKQ